MVYARAKAEMTSRFVTIQIEISRALKFPSIAVSRRIADVDHGASGNLNALQFDIFRGHTEQPLHWALQTHHLFTESFQMLIRVGFEPLPDVGVFDQ